MTPGAGPPLSPGAAGFRGVLCLPGPQTPGASPVSCVAGRGGGGLRRGPGVFYLPGDGAWVSSSPGGLQGLLLSLS